MWILDDQVAGEVAFNGGGFDYLLSKMGSPSVNEEDLREEELATNIGIVNLIG